MSRAQLQFPNLASSHADQGLVSKCFGNCGRKQFLVNRQSAAGGYRTSAGNFQQPTTEQVQLLQKQLEEILKSDAPDALEVGEIVMETRDLGKEIGQAQETFQSDFRALLTPEQIGRIGNINRIALANRAAEALRQLKLR